MQEKTKNKGSKILVIMISILFLIVCSNIIILIINQSPKKRESERVSCNSYLIQLGLYIEMYREGHNNDYPSKLSDFIPDLVKVDDAKSLFFCPTSKKKYVYHRPFVEENGRSIPSNLIFLYDKEPCHYKGRNVMFGSAEFITYMKEDEFQKALQKSKKAFLYYYYDERQAIGKDAVINWKKLKRISKALDNYFRENSTYPLDLQKMTPKFINEKDLKYGNSEEIAFDYMKPVDRRREDLPDNMILIYSNKPCFNNGRNVLYTSKNIVIQGYQFTSPEEMEQEVFEDWIQVIYLSENDFQKEIKRCKNDYADFYENKQVIKPGAITE